MPIKSLKKKKESNPVGRPSSYSEEKTDKICELISTTTMSLDQICILNDDFPDETTVRRWMLKNEEFYRQYARAKMKQADILAEECIKIANSANYEDVAVARLKIDARKWLASKLLPKQYGDSTLLEQKNEENAQLKIELMALRAELDAKNKKPF